MEITIKNLHFTYPNSNQEVLTNINLNISKGKVTSLVGINGSGKTTLLELIDSLYLPTKGEIVIDNIVINSKTRMKTTCPLRRQIGFLFQFSEQQIFQSTVDKELRYDFEVYLTKKDLTENILEVIKTVGLTPEYLERDPYTLSNGEKRKVLLASLLLRDPKVLLLDEPTLGLDGQSKKALIKTLRFLKTKQHKTIILASHDIDFVHAVSDDVVIIKTGQLLSSGDKYQVLTNNTLLAEAKLNQPKLISFVDLIAKSKKIKIGYRDDINDLIKDVYRYAK